LCGELFGDVELNSTHASSPSDLASAENAATAIELAVEWSTAFVTHQMPELLK